MNRITSFARPVRTSAFRPAVLFSLAALSACQTPEAPVPVSVGQAIVPPGMTLAGRFWVEGDPTAGTFDVYPLHDGNVIYRSELLNPNSYNYNNTATQDPNCTWGSSGCLPSSNAVRLHSDQSKVTYCNALGACNTAGSTVTVSSAPCNGSQVFCAPLTLVSNFAYALPNVIVQITSAGQPTDAGQTVLSCLDPSGALGLCASGPTADQNKVKSGSTTTYTGAIGSYPNDCSYCYGNASQAASASPGQLHAVLPGLYPNGLLYNTDTVALQLAHDDRFFVVFNVLYTTPNFISGAEVGATTAVSYTNPGMSGGKPCAVAGVSQVTLAGQGFGPPDQCFQQGLSCPTSGQPHTGYSVTLPTSGTVAAAATSWSDTRITFTVPATAASGHVTVTTPAGSVSSDGTVVPDLVVCPSTGGAAAKLVLSTQTSTVTAGGSFSVTGTLVDANGNVATSGCACTATLGSNNSPDAAPTLASAFTFASCAAHSFSGNVFHTLTSGTLQTLSTTGCFGTSSALSFNVNAGSTTKLVAVDKNASFDGARSCYVLSPAAMAGGTVTVNVDLTSRDANNNISYSFVDQVHFAQTNTGATTASLPANYTYTSFDAGDHVFPVTFTPVTAGDKTTLTITDATNGVVTQATIAYCTSAATASKLVVADASSLTFDAVNSCYLVDSAVGTTVNLRVTAQDASNFTVTTFRDQAHFASSGSTSPTVPADYTYVAGDYGTRSFPITFTSPAFAGAKTTITITDATSGAVTSASIAYCSKATKLVATEKSSLAFDSFNGCYTLPSPATTLSDSVTVSLKVDADDANTVIDSTFTDTLHFASSGPTTATLPANYPYVAGDAGTKTFSLTFVMNAMNAQKTTVTVSDATNAGITSTTISYCNPHPLVNEVQTGSTGSASQEFVEIANPYSFAITLTGWSLFYRSASNNGGGADTTLKAGFTITIPANGYAVACGSAFATNCTAALSPISSGLSATGGAIALKDVTAGVYVDQMSYSTLTATNNFTEGSAAPIPPTLAAPGTSIQRFSSTGNNSVDFKQTTGNTAGLVNL